MFGLGVFFWLVFLLLLVLIFCYCVLPSCSFETVSFYALFFFN